MVERRNKLHQLQTEVKLTTTKTAHGSDARIKQAQDWEMNKKLRRIV